MFTLSKLFYDFSDTQHILAVSSPNKTTVTQILVKPVSIKFFKKASHLFFDLYRAESSIKGNSIFLRSQLFRTTFTFTFLISS